MDRFLQRLILVTACGGILFPALAGCKPTDNATVATPVPMEQRKKEIENNPKMPPQAKAAALAALQRSPSQGSLPGPKAPPPGK